MFGTIPNRKQRKRAERLARKKAAAVSRSQIDMRSATHEAAHVVTAHALGFNVIDVSLSEDNVSRERNNGPGEFAWNADFSRPIETAAVALAGALAEQIIFGDSYSFSDGDKALARKAIDNVTSHSREECQRMATELATSTINLNRRAIEGIARILLQRRFLSGAEIRKMLRRKDS